MKINHYVCRITPQNTLLVLANSVPFDPRKPITQDVRRSLHTPWHATTWHSDPSQGLVFSETGARIIAYRAKRNSFTLSAPTDSSYSLETELRFSLCRRWLEQQEFRHTAVMTEDGYFLTYNPRIGCWTNGDFIFSPKDLQGLVEDYQISFQFWKLADIPRSLYQERPHLQQMIERLAA